MLFVMFVILRVIPLRIVMIIVGIGNTPNLDIGVLVLVIEVELPVLVKGE